MEERSVEVGYLQPPTEARSGKRWAASPFSMQSRRAAPFRGSPPDPACKWVGLSGGQPTRRGIPLVRWFVGSQLDSCECLQVSSECLARRVPERPGRCHAMAHVEHHAANRMDRAFVRWPGWRTEAMSSRLLGGW